MSRGPPLAPPAEDLPVRKPRAWQPGSAREERKQAKCGPDALTLLAEVTPVSGAAVWVLAVRCGVPQTPTGRGSHGVRVPTVRRPWEPAEELPAASQVTFGETVLRPSGQTPAAFLSPCNFPVRDFPKNRRLSSDGGRMSAGVFLAFTSALRSLV